MQFLISKVDIGDNVRHGEHYYVDRFDDATGKATINIQYKVGEEVKSRFYDLFKGQYTTEQEQRIKYNLAAMADERSKQQKAS